MNLKVLYTERGIDYVALSSKLLPEALSILRRAFFPEESVCVAVDLVGNPEAVAELEELCIRTAKDGVSIVAVDKHSNNIVGVLFNKIQIKNSPGEESFFENYAKSCKHASSRCLMEFMINADATIDLFEYCNVNCLLELMILSVLPEYRRRGIGTKLCAVALRVAKLLTYGTNVTHALQFGEYLSLEPVPQIACALFTSPISQKIARALNFQIGSRISYEKCFYEGRSFASVLGKDRPDTAFGYRQILSSKM